jgi:EAL domain-containing protein (putative c-di-GMP-specific phosphodiesterase class I)
VVELSPDYLKLDRELVQGIDKDPNRRALMRAVVAFAREVGTSVIAEGVETRGELDVLRDAEVHLVQGYLLARPGPRRPGTYFPRTSSEIARPALIKLKDVKHFLVCGQGPQVVGH